MADEAPKTPIPQPTKEDHEDVSWALSTAEATWNRGDRADALKWLRRAAESASEAEQDDRALELAKAAAELASQLDPSTGTSSPPNRPMTSAPPMRSMPPPLPAGPARPTKPPGLPPGKGLTASPPAETMVSQQPVQPVRQSVPPTASKVEVQKAPAHSAAPRPAAPTGKPTVKMEAVRTTARYSEAPKEEPSRPDAAKAAVPKASPSAPATTATALPAAASSEGAAGAASVTSITAAPAIPPAAISPDVARAQRLAQMARASSDDTGATWTGAEDRPSEPETPQSKRGANGNADRMSSDPKTPPAALVEERGSRGKYGPPTTRFTSSSSVAEIDAWPTAALTGEVPADFHDENKTRIDAPAYKDSDDLYDGSAIVPPKTGDVRPTQAVRVVVWRAADGVHVAPHGTTVSAISVDAMLVALDPTADLFAWLKGK